MATRIRLRRMGSNKRPFYRVVVADQRNARDGRFIEIIGKYHPLNDPSVIEIDEERALHWLMVGAQPSNQVRNLMTKVGIWERFIAARPSAAAATSTRPDRPVRVKLSKKAQAKAAEAAKTVETPAAAAETPEAAAADEPPAVEAVPETAEATPEAAEETVTEPTADETPDAPADADAQESGEG